MAVTRAGIHQADGAEAVLTVIEAGEIESAIRDRFRSEAEALSFKPTPHVLPPHLWGEETGWLWCAWPRLAGDHAGRLMRTSGIPPLYVTLEVSRQMALGLQELESAGYCHGALSPASVFVDSQAKVRLLHAPWGRLLEGIEGRYLHPAWMSLLPFTAPEVASEGQPTPAGDAYSVGAFLYFMILGRPLHWADDPQELLQFLLQEPPDLQPLAETTPGSVVDLLEELLSLDPRDRPVNWPALAQRLAQCAQNAQEYGGEVPTWDAVTRQTTPPQDFPLVGSQASPPSTDLADTDYGLVKEEEEEEPEDLVDPRLAVHEDTPEPDTALMEEDQELSEADLPRPADAFRDRVREPPAPAAVSDAASAPAPPPQPRLSARDEYGVEGSHPAEGIADDKDKQRAGSLTVNYGPSTAVESTGISPRVLLLIVGGLVAVLAAAAITFFILRNSGDSERARATSGSNIEVSGEPAIPKDPDYTQTANNILVLGRFVQLYYKAYHKYPTTFRELGRDTGNPIDAWGTPLDLREGFVVSAGKDKTWDTDDDLFFDPETSLIGGYVEAVDLPEGVLDHPSSAQSSPSETQPGTAP